MYLVFPVWFILYFLIHKIVFDDFTSSSIRKRLVCHIVIFTVEVFGKTALYNSSEVDERGSDLFDIGLRVDYLCRVLSDLLFFLYYMRV